MDWKYTLDLTSEFNNAQDSPPEKFGKLIARKLQTDAYIKQNGDRYSRMIITRLANMEADCSFDDFDEIWDEFYDWADQNKIWIKT